jgi:hypothetical protein
MTVLLCVRGGSTAGRGDHVLAFDPAAAGVAAAAGAVVDLVDDLLDWDRREAIDAEATRLTELVADNGGLPGDVRTLAAYDLLTEFVNLLRGWWAGREWARRRPRVHGNPVEADGACPGSILIGVRAALGDDRLPSPWTPVSQPAATAGARIAAARAITAGLRAARRHGGVRRIRILAVPGMNVGAAIARTDPAALRRHGVGLAMLPTIEHGATARLAVSVGLPVASAAWPRRDDHAESAVQCVADESALRYAEDAALARALRCQAGRTLVASEHPARQVRATLRRWESELTLEALLLPTVANGAGRMASAWARDRQIPVGVVQHGIYAFRGAEGGDRAADLILTWGPGVADQVAEWEGVRAATRVVGVPGIAVGRPQRPTAGVRRVLVATPNNPMGSALGLAAFQESFLTAIGPAVQRLVAAGARIELRTHPAEDRTHYEEAIARLALPVSLSHPEPLDAALERADLVISSVSSVAFEAAARGLLVLIWTGGVPEEVRRRQFLSPVAESLPGMFDDADQLLSLFDAPGEPDRSACQLSEELRRYVSPFNAEDFIIGLDELRRWHGAATP